MEKGSYRDLFLSEGREILRELNNTLVLLEKNPNNKEFFNEIFRHAHTLKGMASTMGYQSITELSHAAEEILALFREKKLKPEKETLNLLFETCDVLETLVEKVAAGEEESLSQTPQIAPLLEKLKKVTSQKKEKQKPKSPVVATENKTEKTAAAQSNEKSKGEMIRVSLDQLDNVMNLVGELLIHRVRLSALLKDEETPVVREAIGRFEQVTEQLQNEMLQLRLIPMDYIFNRFPRMVRDLAFEEKKQVNLVIEGGEIGLDRTILDKISEPLIHLLRNAVTHGIEPPEPRVRLGKAREGLIKVSARRERHFVVIEVSDDGNGMEAEKIRRTAVERGLISPQEAKGLSEEEVIRLISLPGFTTTPVVTAASGRGVGMHTVKTVVESCGGTLKIEVTPRVGSIFTLKLPVTMAIVPSLLVRIQKETYVIPLVNVLEIIKIDSHLPKRVEEREMIAYRDGLLALVRLGEKLGFKTTDEKNGKPLSVAVVEVGHRKAGLVVDQFLGQQEVVIKALSDRLKTIKGLSGATILADGKVAPILDLGSVL